MPSLQAYTYRMPAGFAGDMQRIEQATIETQIIDPTNPPTAFGVPVKLVNGKIQPIGAGDTAAAVYGINIRAYPLQGVVNDPLATATPPVAGTTDINLRGYQNVALNGTTAATKGGVVYIRIAAAAAGKPIGGFEAAADSTNTIVMPNAIFTGPADAYGISEIAYNI
ncbi:structural cement protein Gp24 [Robbsia andropogonis]|uniref:structural cement protein Gp24 n=1 Tax=Robbsia andropogonis TaxID=28092 RepID=UPI003D20BDA2